MYGLVGWLLDRWLGTSFLLPVGIVLGAALGVLTIHLRFRSSDRD
jgi:ATP synthase protein I